VSTWHDTRLDRDVALALIKTEGLDAGALACVRREAQAMGRLGDHPHIVTVHDIGEENGQPGIVSQFMRLARGLAGRFEESRVRGPQEEQESGSGPRTLGPFSASRKKSAARWSTSIPMA
jgi:hypothetical protein